MDLDDVPVHETADGLAYVRTGDLPEEYREAYDRWLWGQTLPLIVEAPDASYAWDFETWRSRVIKNKPYVWD